MNLYDKILLRKRAVIETANDELKYLGANVDVVRESPQLSIQLIPDGKQFRPRLVYEVDCRPKTGAVASYPGGWVDARTGRMITTFTINI